MLIGFHRSHEASVVLIDEDGQPLFAAAEERLSRVKLQGGWPRLIAAYVAEHFAIEGAQAVHGGPPLSQRFGREARLALYNARHGRLQDVHPKRFRKLADLAFWRTANSESA
ncbi:MAG: hypothetical protein JRE13_15865, partial [Deltaproteobacteria bacterium]|nr:hypothetical protein [Deltaproteobacteria bacterium]